MAAYRQTVIVCRRLHNWILVNCVWLSCDDPSYASVVASNCRECFMGTMFLFVMEVICSFPAVVLVGVVIRGSRLSTSEILPTRVGFQCGETVSHLSNCLPFS